MVMDLLSLPWEILTEIISLLVFEDISSVSSTCKSLNRIISDSEEVWSKSCRNHLKLKIPFVHGLTSKFCQRILYRYRHLIGLWQAHVDCYGGLLQIKYEDFKLIGVDLLLPREPQLSAPLRPKTIFTIHLSEHGNTCIKCCINSNKRHPCSLTYGPKRLTATGPTINVLTRECCEGSNDDHQGNPDISVELANWLEEQSDFTEDFGLDREMSIYKYMVISPMRTKSYYTRFSYPHSIQNVPIQSGLFKGTYSAHGYELISLEYEDGATKMKAIKITGDPNIPAGETTFRADLPYCMHLTAEQQSSIEAIERIEPIMSQVTWDELPVVQPYVDVGFDDLPASITVPSVCRARFHGFGQLANHAYSDPEFVQGHWVVFDEDWFGFLFITLNSLSLFHRVKENLV